MSNKRTCLRWGWFALLLLLAGCLPRAAGQEEVAIIASPTSASTNQLAPTPISGSVPTQPTTPPLPTATLIVVATLPPPLIQPTNTPPAQPTTEPTPEPSPVPASETINGLPREQFLRLSPETIAHMREVYARGQEIHGRDPRRFSKLGDSLSANYVYLSRFDTGEYNLGDYNYLQPTIDHFRGSFARESAGVKVGIAAISALGSQYANPDLCLPSETMFACEIRLHNPSILLIRFGTNDADKTAFGQNLQRLIEATLAQGIIPVLATKADRYADEEDITNTLIRQLAEAYNVPLWDFDYVANSLPNRGLGDDNVHLTPSLTNDFRDPAVLQKGYPVTDLLTLMMLAELRAQVLGD
jgi:lysophospholipase L1-like esterase